MHRNPMRRRREITHVRFCLGFICWKYLSFFQKPDNLHCWSCPDFFLLVLCGFFFVCCVDFLAQSQSAKSGLCLVLDIHFFSFHVLKMILGGGVPKQTLLTSRPIYFFPPPENVFSHVQAPALRGGCLVVGGGGLVHDLLRINVVKPIAYGGLQFFCVDLFWVGG